MAKERPPSLEQIKGALQSAANHNRPVHARTWGDLIGYLERLEDRLTALEAAEAAKRTTQPMNDKTPPNR